MAEPDSSRAERLTVHSSTSTMSRATVTEKQTSAWKERWAVRVMAVMPSLCADRSGSCGFKEMADQTSKALLLALDERDGRRSAWTGNEGDTCVPQHRQGGMDGRATTHHLSNVVWLESDINGLIESDPEWQYEALKRGIKISGYANPELAEVRHAVHGLVLLRDNG